MPGSALFQSRAPAGDRDVGGGRPGESPSRQRVGLGVGNLAEMGSGFNGTEIKGAPCPDLTLRDREQETLPLICKNGDETGALSCFLVNAYGIGTWVVSKISRKGFASH